MKKEVSRIFRLVVLGGMVSTILASSVSGQLYTGWTSYQDYGLNTVATGISTNQVNFPVLLRLTSANAAVFSNPTSPADLRFAKGGNLNVGYPYQVQRWDATDELAEIWILVDTVFSGSTSQSLRMYWGNAGATAASSGPAVFSAVNGFVAVWHLSDLTDATGAYGLHTSTNSAPTKAAGLIDTCYSFTGTSGGSYLANTGSYLGSHDTLTISSWVSLSSSATVDGQFIWLGNAAGIRACASTGTGHCMMYDTNATAAAFVDFQDGPTVKGLGWQYIAGVFNPVSSNEFYWQNDSIPASVVPITGSRMGTQNHPIVYNGTGEGDSVLLGTGTTATTAEFNGLLNEIRVENVARSADWLTTCYANQRAGQTFITPISLTMPSVPVLSSPSNGATNQQLTPNLIWSSASGATSYNVLVSASSAFGTTAFSQTGITATSITASALANSTTYYWEVSASNVSLTSAWSSDWSFTTTALPLPGVPALSSPTNGAVNQPVNLALNWGAVTIATGYVAQVSTSSNFNTTVFSQSGLTTTTASVASLANNTTYYWRAEATNLAGSGAWSGTWSFVTIIAVAGTPTLSSPASGTASEPTSLTLNWTQDNGAASYILQVSTSSAFGTTLLNEGVSGLSASVGNLAIGTIYYWEVAGVNAAGQGAWSAAWNFSTVATAALPKYDQMIAKTDFAVNGDALVYTLASSGAVEISFSDLLGRSALVLNCTQSAGRHALELKNINLSAGQYIVRFKAAGVEKQASLMITR